MVIAAGVVVGGSYWRLESNLKTVDLTKEIDPARPPSTPGRPLNILLIGKDDGRSDTAMVVQLNAKGDQARVVSIPRDTMVPRPRCGDHSAGRHRHVQQRLLHGRRRVHGGDGRADERHPDRPLRADRLQRLPRRSSTRSAASTSRCRRRSTTTRAGCTCRPGRTRLDGTQALAFVRTRYSIGDGSDLNRIKNQQLFMRGVESRNWRTRTGSRSPAKTFQLADILTKSIVTDEEIGSIGKLADLARKLAALKPGTHHLRDAADGALSHPIRTGFSPSSRRLTRSGRQPDLAGRALPLPGPGPRLRRPPELLSRGSVTPVGRYHRDGLPVS